MTTKRFNIHSDEDNETIWISDVQKHKEIEIQHYYGIATVVKMLNELHEDLNHELTVSKALRDVVKELEKKNDELKSIKKFAEIHGINIFKIDEAFQKCWNDNGKLIKENEQLKSLIKALKKSNTDYIHQIKKAYDEKLSIKELADNCGVDLE